MATVAVIAVKRGDSWRGVYVYGDGYLQGVGNALLKAAAAVEGKLEKLVESHIDAVPGGWESYPARTHSDSSFPNGIAPSNLNEVDPAYFYLIDTSQRTIVAYRSGSLNLNPGHPPGLERFEHVGQVQVLPDGTLSSPDFAIPDFEKLPWPHLRVATGWKLSRQIYNDTRVHNARKMGSRLVAQGLTEETARMVLITSLSEVLRNVTWDAHDNSTQDNPDLSLVFVQMPWARTSEYWEVSLGTTRVRYPTLNGSRSDMSVRLFANPGHVAELETTPSRIFQKRSHESLAYPFKYGDATWLYNALDWLRMLEIDDPELRFARWRSYHHVDGRIWSVRATADGYEIGLAKMGDSSSTPIVRSRSSPTPFDDLDKLVKEQVDDGFVEAGSSWTLK